MNTTLEAKLKTLPRSPGVYFHKDKNSQVIYVGKAAVLKNRVRQYFQSKRDMDVKTRALVDEIWDTDWVETESEIDALFLESEMVKRYMPRYNILLRDDKSQLYVRIDMKSEWPHVSFTRNPADDRAEYYGPYYNGYALKKALRYLRKTFPYYTRAPKVGERASLDAHLGLEPYGMSSEEYKQQLRKLISYIKGNRIQLIRELEQEMKRAALEHEFEHAAQIRNRLQNLKELRRRIMFGDKEFLDISKDKALQQLVEILNLPKTPARIEGFDISHISGTDVVASQVVFVNGVSSRSDYRKYKLKQQQNDDYASMYEVISRRLSERNIKAWGMPDLLVIDGGKGQLAAAVRARDERGIELRIVSIAKREEELIVPKDNGEYAAINLHDGRKSSGHAKNIIGGVDTGYGDVVKLFQRIRDESHRFAISYHTVLRKQRQTVSVLEGVPGVGPMTRKKLLKAFGSVRGIAAADMDALVRIVGVQKASTLKKYLHAEAGVTEGES